MIFMQTQSMKNMQNTSSLRRLPTAKSIRQEKEKILVIILCEDQNPEFEQFCLDVYDQSIYFANNSLAEISIVDTYEEFSEIQKQPNKDYFILSSDKALKQIKSAQSIRQFWVVYDSSKKGSVKKIHDLPNVVYRTRQIQSLRDKLQSRKFIQKKKVLNEKHRQNNKKQNKKVSLLKKIPKQDYSLEEQNIQGPLKTQSIEKDSQVKNQQYGQNNSKKTKKFIFIKSKASKISSKLLKTQKQLITRQENHHFNTQAVQSVKQLRTSKSNQMIAPLQPISDYESLQNLQLESKNSNFACDPKNMPNHIIQNVDDYEFFKIVPNHQQNAIKPKNCTKKDIINLQKFSNKNQIHFPLSKEKSDSLNYFYDRKHISDRLNQNKLKKNRIPENSFQMKLHYFKSQIKNRSLLSKANSLDLKYLTSSKQSLKNKQKSSEKLRISQQKYLSSGKKEGHKNKSKIFNEQLSTVQSEEYNTSPKKNQLKPINKQGLKRFNFFQNPLKKVKQDTEKILYKKEPQFSSKQQLSALYLVDYLIPTQLFDEISTEISTNDSIYKFRSFSQLKNQIKQAENVYQLIFVFNQQPFIDLEIGSFCQRIPSCYFVSIDPNIQSFQISKNQIKMKNFNFFNQIHCLVIK